MGCCTYRMKEEHNDTLFDTLSLHQVNTLPTFDNMFNVYCDLKLPDLNPFLLRHKKEQMVFMIVNMVRTQPKLYIQYMSILQDRCLQRQSPQNLAFRYEDVDDAISLLKEMEPRGALKLSPDLCIYSINMLDRDSDFICSFD